MTQEIQCKHIFTKGKKGGLQCKVKPKNGDFCSSHKRCVEQGCNKGAVNGYDSCKPHGGGKRCIESDCKNSAISPTDFCRKHGGGKRCVESECKNSAASPTDFCKKHGGGKRCVESDCKNSAISPTDFCISHGGGKRCSELGCKSSARGPTDFCRKHGGGKRCSESGCKNSAVSPTEFCKAHGGGKRCILCMACSVNTYDPYCARCYYHLNPDDIKGKNYKTKENLVVDFIKTTYPCCFKLFDRATPDTCKLRPDIVLDKNKKIVIIEVDENQHRYYDTTCEEARVNILFEAFGSKRTIFIRFNPDSYTDIRGNKVKSCFKTTSKGVSIRDKKLWENRLEQLGYMIEYHLFDDECKDPVSMEYLFYDEINEKQK